MVNAPAKAGQPIGILNIDLERERLVSIKVVAPLTRKDAPLGLSLAWLSSNGYVFMQDKTRGAFTLYFSFGCAHTERI